MTKNLIIPLPEWFGKRDIYVFAGREVIARKLQRKLLEIKTIRCNLCGNCCRNLTNRWKFGITEDGTCNYLKFERVHHSDGKVVEGYVCKLPGDHVPFTCCRGRGTKEEKCVTEFKPVKSDV